MSTTASQTGSEYGQGVLQGAGAYFLWGLLPVYFLLLPPIGAMEFVAVRVLFSLLFCAALLLKGRQYRHFFTLFRSPRTVLLLGLASLLIAGSWSLYALAILTNRVLEASLGNFINPIVVILLGVVVLREKLRRLQWAALGLAVVAVLVLSVGLGQVPWISLGMAFTFGLYGLVKNRIGAKGTALESLTMETLLLTPLSLVYVAWLGEHHQSALVSANWVTLLLMAGTGILTAIPLLLFGAAAKRLPLATLGSVQFLAPILQLVFGLLVFHEQMPPERWAGFALVWIAVAFVLWDMIRLQRRQRIPAGTAHDPVPAQQEP